MKNIQNNHHLLYCQLMNNSFHILHNYMNSCIYCNVLYIYKIIDCLLDNILYLIHFLISIPYNIHIHCLQLMNNLLDIHYNQMNMSIFCNGLYICNISNYIPCNIQFLLHLYIGILHPYYF